MPAKEFSALLSEYGKNDENADKIKKAFNKHYRANGLFLRNIDVIAAMDKNMNGQFIPVTIGVKRGKKKSEEPELEFKRSDNYLIDGSQYEGEFKARKASLSEKALEELKALTEASLKSIDYSLRIFAKDDFHELPKADRLEQDVDDLQTDFINNHIQRLMNNECDPVGGVLFTDMVNDLERCSDHAINIAYALFHNTPEHHNAQA